MLKGGIYMSKLVISGGTPLRGEVTISGAKNAAVAIIPATLLVNGVCRLDNLPMIDDVKVILHILEQLGAKITREESGTVEIDCSDVKSTEAPYEMVKKMRASIYLLGALLGRFRKAKVALPGGCDFGVRPIDLHVKGFKAMGASVRTERGSVVAKAGELTGTTIFMDKISVGATINVMLAATLAEGTTVIEHAAKEPHVVDLANFLNTMGANIKGAGTDTITVTGVKSLKGGSYDVIPDQIEAGTYMIAAAATGGNVLIKNVIPRHMESLSAKLMEAGAEVVIKGDTIRVSSTLPLSGVKVETQPYPGFPTDLQPQMTAMLSTAKTQSAMVETVWNSRFQYVDELKRMGADISVSEKSAIINPVETLYGTEVRATDLRAGAGMVIAGLMAEGTTTVDNLHYIRRGYEHLVEKMTALGADISVDESDGQ